MIPKPIEVRGRVFDPPLFLAPMAGLTHMALNTVIAGFGGVGCYFTEMLSARSLRTEDPLKSPYLIRSKEERPLCYQILASNPEEVETGALTVARLGADAVDLNFGCPAPLIRRRGGGSKLMENRDISSLIVEAARRAAGTLPLSAKIRLGETLDEEVLKDFCQMLTGSGVDLIHVHARLRGEHYGRKPRWEWVAKVKSWVSVPVVVNGSIDGPESALAALKASGADGLMIGRAAARKPWVFRDIRNEVFKGQAPLPLPETGSVYGRFLSLLEENFPPEKRLGRLKEFTHYFASNFHFGHTLASKVQASETVDEAKERAREFFAAFCPEFEGFK